MKPLPLLAALLCALVLAACGDDGGEAGSGGSSDEQAVRDATERYIEAFTDGDAKAVCDMLTPAARKQVTDAFAELGGGDCHEVMETAFGFLEDKDREELKATKVESVKVTGDTATVTVTGSDEAPSGLTKVDGRWLIEADDEEAAGTETAESAADETTEVDPAPEEDAEAEPAQTTVGIGEPLRQEGYTVTVVRQRTASKLPGDEFSDPVPADGRFIILTLRVRNGGREVATFDTSLVELVDEDGTVYSSETGGGEDQIMALPDYLDERAIQPKTSETGDVAFDVPDSANVVRAQFASTLDLFGDEFTGAVELR